MWVLNYEIMFGITSRQLKVKVKQQVLHFAGKHPVLSGGASRFAWQLRADQSRDSALWSVALLETELPAQHCWIRR